MAGFSDLFGRSGLFESFFIWQIGAQLVTAELQPFLTTLEQDVNQFHPVVALPAELAVEAYVRGFLSRKAAEGEAAKNGIDAARFAVMADRARVRLAPEQLAAAADRKILAEADAARQAAAQGIDAESFAALRTLARVRLAPADLATAVLRSYLTMDQAIPEAEIQGVNAADLRILADLAGDAPGPDQLVTARRRGIIPAHGHGPESISFDQGIAETRLHNKWGPVLDRLGEYVLSPPDAATAVIRNFLSREQGTAVAALSGVSEADFNLLADLAGDAPGPQQLAEALRRGLIKLEGTGAGSTSFMQGIAEGRLKDKWAPVIQGLAQLWPTPVDALAAALKGQVPPEEGKRLYKLLGGDEQFYGWLLDSQGEGPSALEAADMARRGIIPWDGTGPQVTSYTQAVRESRYRNKWTEAYRKYAEYVPPPETVRTMLQLRAITEDQAIALWHKSGLDQETVTAFLQAAAFDDTAATRGLAVNDILQMYYDQLIGDSEARQLLTLFHVPGQTVDLLLAYTLVRRSANAVTMGVRRIQSLFTARKISLETARDALTRFGIPGSTIDGMISTWEVEASVSVKTLTAAEILDAWAINVMTDADALAELEAIGYTPYDAWVKLSIKNKGPAGEAPPRIVAAPFGAVTPGVT